MGSIIFKKTMKIKTDYLQHLDDLDQKWNEITNNQENFDNQLIEQGVLIKNIESFTSDNDLENIVRTLTFSSSTAFANYMNFISQYSAEYWEDYANLRKSYNYIDVWEFYYQD